jgi:hypothetical protein
MVTHTEIQSPSEDRETALLRAWRAACREYELNGRPHEDEPEDQGWNLDIAAGAAEGELIGPFSPKIAEPPRGCPGRVRGSGSEGRDGWFTGNACWVLGASTC